MEEKEQKEFLGNIKTLEDRTLIGIRNYIAEYDSERAILIEKELNKRTAKRRK